MSIVAADSSFAPTEVFFPGEPNNLDGRKERRAPILPPLRTLLIPITPLLARVLTVNIVSKWCDLHEFRVDRKIVPKQNRQHAYAPHDHGWFVSTLSNIKSTIFGDDNFDYSDFPSEIEACDVETIIYYNERMVFRAVRHYIEHIRFGVNTRGGKAFELFARMSQAFRHIEQACFTVMMTSGEGEHPVIPFSRDVMDLLRKHPQYHALMDECREHGWHFEIARDGLDAHVLLWFRVS